MMHKHHIIPKHAGGTNDPSNFIKLTIPEHAEAHRVLWEQHGRWQDRMAWLMLSGRTEEGEVVRLEMIRSPEVRAKQSAARKGKSHTPEARAKISAARMGYVPTPEARLKMSASHKGIEHSLEHRAKISASCKAACIRITTQINQRNMHVT